MAVTSCLFAAPLVMVSSAWSIILIFAVYPALILSQGPWASLKTKLIKLILLVYLISIRFLLDFDQETLELDIKMAGSYNYWIYWFAYVPGIVHGFALVLLPEKLA